MPSSHSSLQANAYKRRCALRALAGLLCFLSASAASAQVLVAPGEERYQRPYAQSRGVLSYADLLEGALDAAVKVLNIGVDDNNEPVLSGSGSGVIYDGARGLILTNDHVIDGARGLLIERADGVLVEVKLVGTDPATDLAVLQAESAFEHEARFVDTRTLRVGDLVFAVGYPRGLDRGISAGIISGLHRRGFKSSAESLRIEDFIQTDAAINPGNSGGPLVDTRGRVVGINTFIFRESDGLGFAIPSTVAITIAKRIEAGGPFDPGWFGVSVDSLTPNRARELGLQTSRGVVVNTVSPSSPAQRAGLVAGDIVTGAGARRIDDVFQFANFMLLAELGRSYPIYYYRDGAPRRSSIVLTTREGYVPNTDTDRSGVTASPTPEAVTFFGAALDRSTDQAIIVASVSAGSIAERKGLRPGDRLVSFDKQLIDSLTPIARWLELNSGKPVPVLVERAGRRFTVIF